MTLTMPRDKLDETLRLDKNTMNKVLITFCSGRGWRMPIGQHKRPGAMASSGRGPSVGPPVGGKNCYVCNRQHPGTGGFEFRAEQEQNEHGLVAPDILGVGDPHCFLVDLRLQTARHHDPDLSSGYRTVISLTVCTGAIPINDPVPETGASQNIRPIRVGITPVETFCVHPTRLQLGPGTINIVHAVTCALQTRIIHINIMLTPRVRPVSVGHPQHAH